VNVPQLLLDLGQPLKKGDIVHVEWRTKVGKQFRYVTRNGELMKSDGRYVVLTLPSSGRRFRIRAEQVVSIKRAEP
jgi:hypothetical protein